VSDRNPLMGRRTVVWLLAVGLVSVSVATYFTIFGSGAPKLETSGTNSFSVSAVGHRAFVSMLQELDIPVLVSRRDTSGKSDQSVLVIAEPLADPLTLQRLREVVDVSSTVLVVLPKWRPYPDGANPAWISTAVPLPRSALLRVLDNVYDYHAAIIRPRQQVSWVPSRFGIIPDIDRPQFIRSKYLDPLIASDQGILLGEHHKPGQARVWVLSDPDLLANHGLHRGDNAALVAQVIEALRTSAPVPFGGATVVYDETLHGLARDPSILRELFRFPLVLALLHAGAAVLVLLWSASGRFGSPVPAPAPLRAGKRELIDNVASLLQFGGHTMDTFNRYFDTTSRDVARRLHAPRDLDDGARAMWLDRIGESRGLATSLTAVRDAIEQPAGPMPEEQKALRAAWHLYRWKQEMLHGPRDRSSDRRRT